MSLLLYIGEEHRDNIKEEGEIEKFEIRQLEGGSE